MLSTLDFQSFIGELAMVTIDPRIMNNMRTETIRNLINIEDVKIDDLTDESEKDLTNNYIETRKFRIATVFVGFLLLLIITFGF